jgi:hypothetical protein
MSHAINMGWFILNKYYHKSDETPAYAAALLLNPSCRAKYLNKNWDKAWIDDTITSVSTLWEGTYKTIEVPTQEGNSGQVQEIQESEKGQSRYQLLMRQLDVVERKRAQDDFYDFINAEPIDIGESTPLQWWCCSEQRTAYPRLHRMAMDILSIPPMSDDVEGVFSGGRRTVSWDRHKLTPCTIEMLECCGNWIKNNLAQGNELAELIEDLRNDASDVEMGDDDSIDGDPANF